MEDSSINMMSYFGNESGQNQDKNKSQSYLTPINEEQNYGHRSNNKSVKPPRRGNVAVGGYGAGDVSTSQLSLLGHRSRRNQTGQKGLQPASSRGS